MFLTHWKHPNFSALQNPLLWVPSMPWHLKLLSTKSPSLHDVPKFWVTQNMSSQPAVQSDEVHPSSDFPCNPEFFASSCLTFLNSKSPSWTLGLLLLGLLRPQITHQQSFSLSYFLMFGSPTSFAVPREAQPLHLLWKRSKTNKNPQAETCYQKLCYQKLT